MMEAAPAASLVVPEAQFLFQLLVVALDPPAPPGLDPGVGQIDQAIELDFPPWSGGVRSERHAAARMVIPSMLARASAGVR